MKERIQKTEKQKSNDVLSQTPISDDVNKSKDRFLYQQPNLNSYSFCCQNDENKMLKTPFPFPLKRKKQRHKSTI